MNVNTMLVRGESNRRSVGRRGLLGVALGAIGGLAIADMPVASGTSTDQPLTLGTENRASASTVLITKLRGVALAVENRQGVDTSDVGGSGMLALVGPRSGTVVIPGSAAVIGLNRARGRER